MDTFGEDSASDVAKKRKPVVIPSEARDLLLAERNASFRY